jgi:hypothetical protein
VLNLLGENNRSDILSYTNQPENWTKFSTFSAS